MIIPKKKKKTIIIKIRQQKWVEKNGEKSARFVKLQSKTTRGWFFEGG